MVEDHLIWDSSMWSNGVSRTILTHRQKDPYDKRLEIASGTGRKGFIDGMGNGYLSGSQARYYIHGTHYNAKLKGIFQLNSTISTLSLRLRSRHLVSLQLPTDSRFAGYGCAISLTQVQFLRENYHDNYTNIGTAITLTTALENKKDYPMAFTVIDDGATVDLELLVDYGSGLTSVGTQTDSSPPTGATNHQLFDEISHAFIRTNGTEPLDLKMRNVELYDVVLT